MRTHALVLPLLILVLLAGCQDDNGTDQAASDAVSGDTTQSVGTEGSADAAFLTEAQRAEQAAVDEATLSWNVYIDPRTNVAIKYPVSVAGFGEATWHYEAYETDDVLLDVGFGPLETQAGGYVWNVRVVPGADVEATVNNLVARYKDSTVHRDVVIVDGIPATRATITAKQAPVGALKVVFVPHHSSVAIISNGSVDLPEYDMFYQTFTFTE